MCVKKIVKNIMLVLLISILIFSLGCNDATTGKVIQNTINEINENTDINPIVQGIVTDVIDDLPVEFEDNKNLTNKTKEEEIQSTEPVIVDEDKYPELNDGKIYEYTLNKDFDFDKLKDITEGDTHIINIDDQKYILKLLKVTSDGKSLFEFNGRSSDFYENGDTIRLSKEYKLEIGAGLFNDPWSTTKSLTEIKFIQETLESYPDFFVEENIGSYEYEISKKIDSNTYKAYYSNNLIVTIKPNYNFLNNYKDDDNLYLFDDMDYIYRILDEDDNIIELAWFSDNITISMNKKSDLVLERYLKKHPTELEKELYCTEEHRMIEGDSDNFYIKGNNYEFYFVGVDAESKESKFEINGEFFPSGSKLDLKERKEIAPGIEIEVKQIWPDYLDGKDRIRFCFLYDDN